LQFKNQVEEYYKGEQVLEVDIEGQRVRKSSNIINLDEQGVT